MSKKIKTIIIIVVCICALAIIIGIIGALSTNKKEETEQHIEEQKGMPVQEVTSVKKAYNIGKCVNDMIQYIYEKGWYEHDMILVPRGLTEQLDLKNGLKKFYEEKSYEAKLDDDINVYFTEGYLAYEQDNKTRIKDNIKLTLINDAEYNTCMILDYGQGYREHFKYSKEISETEVLKTSGLKIKKTNNENKQLDEVIMDNEFYQNKNLEENVSENDLVYWYYSDYKIKEAIKNNTLAESRIAFSYEGNYEDGYTITDRENKQYFIKPGKTPMDYEVTLK